MSNTNGELASCGSQEVRVKKTTEADIIVRGTPEKPYYEIKYFDIADGQWHIGYGSYYLNYVFQWLKECFEVVSDES